MPEHSAGPLPPVIQGGMGVAVSSWPLARAVSMAGGLGVVSGTALDAVLARRLQDGDPGGRMREALEAFPVPEIAERVLGRYFRASGRSPGAPYTPVPRLGLRQDRDAQELTVAANFAEVWLAKRGHQGPVGVNYLDKIRMAMPAAAYGAMLAGVDVVLAGAGIPRELPMLLSTLARHEPVSLPVEVIGAPPGQRYAVSLDPAALSGPGRAAAQAPGLPGHRLRARPRRVPCPRPADASRRVRHRRAHGRRPQRAAARPAARWTKRASPGTARATTPTWRGWPRSGCRSGWPAPATARPASRRPARPARPACRRERCSPSARSPGSAATCAPGCSARLRDGTLQVRTDPVASPTGFPFKVARLPGTLSDEERYTTRPRLCDLGHLRVPYARPSGAIGYRCPGEPVHTYLRKGGDAADTAGRACLCNALLADVGLGQTRRSGYAEDPLVTLGSGLDGAAAMLQRYPAGWSAAQAVTWLLADPRPGQCACRSEPGDTAGPAVTADMPFLPMAGC